MARQAINYGVIRRLTGEHVALFSTREVAIMLARQLEQDDLANGPKWEFTPSKYDVIQVKGKVF